MTDTVVNLTDSKTGDFLTLHFEANYDNGPFVSVIVTDSRGVNIVDAVTESMVQVANLINMGWESGKKFRDLLDNPPRDS